MTSTSPTLPTVPDLVFTGPERLALAGFLAGYRGLTRDAYALDLRQFLPWCERHGLKLFSGGSADIELYARAGGGWPGPGHRGPEALYGRRLSPLRRRRGPGAHLAGGPCHRKGHGPGPLHQPVTGRPSRACAAKAVLERHSSSAEPPLGDDRLRDLVTARRQHRRPARGRRRRRAQAVLPGARPQPHLPTPRRAGEGASLVRRGVFACRRGDLKQDQLPPG